MTLHLPQTSLRDSQVGGGAVAYSLPQLFGFRSGLNSVHRSRTMMLAELTALLGATRADSTPNNYVAGCIEDNVLSKRTLVTRRTTAERLRELYALDPGVTVFRLLRQFWSADPEARPLLACLCAQARDPLFRATADSVLATKAGEVVTVDALCRLVDGQEAGRFGAKTLRSVAQNLASSWNQSGFLSGTKRKIRRR